MSNAPPNDSGNSARRGSERAIPQLLREVDTHYRQLLANVQDYAIFLMTPTGEIVNWNAGAERIKGYRAEEIVGHNFEEFYPQAAVDSGWPQEELRRAKEFGRLEDEGWRVRKDGTQFWANVVITALRDERGEVQGFLKITRDLTERKQIEEALRQSEQRFRLLVEGIRGYAIYMLDPDGKVATWNRGAEEIHGYSAHDILGEHFSAFYTPDDKEAGKPEENLRLALANGRIESEGWRVRSDGAQFWASVVHTALYNDQKQLRGFATVTRDMTESRKVESLQFADKRKNEFLALLAHELRNPLAPISNGVELLAVLNAHDAEMAEVTGIMKRQIDHLVRLVDDLLDVSRILNGKITMQVQPINLVTAIEHSIEDNRVTAKSAGHDLRAKLPETPLTVNGDLVRLTQVITNLVVNAIKYSPQPCEIVIEAEREGKEAVVRVRDRGMGIAADELPTIFNIFSQAESSLSRSHGGLGLGLTLVKRVVEMHGGTVTAGSPGLGLGSEFTIRLPLAK